MKNTFFVDCRESFHHRKADRSIEVWHFGFSGNKTRRTAYVYLDKHGYYSFFLSLEGLLMYIDYGDAYMRVECKQMDEIVEDGALEEVFLNLILKKYPSQFINHKKLTHHTMKTF